LPALTLDECIDELPANVKWAVTQEHRSSVPMIVPHLPKLCSPDRPFVWHSNHGTTDSISQANVTIARDSLSALPVKPGPWALDWT
jgi:hypothetical protein